MQCLEFYRWLREEHSGKEVGMGIVICSQAFITFMIYLDRPLLFIVPDESSRVFLCPSLGVRFVYYSAIYYHDKIGGINQFQRFQPTVTWPCSLEQWQHQASQYRIPGSRERWNPGSQSLLQGTLFPTKSHLFKFLPSSITATV